MRPWILGLAFLTACGPGPRTPRFGSLRAFDERTFHFEHGVSLFSAKNGLQVALIPDARTNLVSVDVRYTVGAAEDPAGRAGLAHLVEHLMFTLRATADGPTIADELGEASLFYNAYTTFDETHYTSTALAPRLGEVLALEARRLDARCDQLDDAVFVRERDVVLEELAVRSTPLDGLREELSRAVWGEGHPYARGVGSREIADVTKQEACDFIAAHYAPDRAILVVAGALDVDAASAQIGKAFGPIGRHATGARATIDLAELDGKTTEHTADVEEATAMVFFQRPAWGTDHEVDQQLVSALIEAALGSADRDDAWITDAGVSELGGMRASTLVVYASVKDPAKLEDAVARIYEATRTLGGSTGSARLPALRGLLRARYAAAYDAFAGRGAWIADYLQYRADNQLMIGDLADIDAATGERLAAYAETIFQQERSHVALVRPSRGASRTERATIASSSRDYDLAPWRAPVDASEAERALEVRSTRVAARVQELTADNGLRVLLAPDPTSPVIEARVVLPVGTIADPDDQRGLAWLSAALLDHDYEQQLDRADVDRATWAIQLGTVMSADVDETHTTFAVGGLAVFADWHLWRLTWLLDLGDYSVDDLREVRERVAAADVDPDEADRALRAKVFGAGHPYASPTSALGGASHIQVADLRAFRKAHYALRGATLIISGGFDEAQIKGEIAELFGFGDFTAAALATPPAPSPAPGPSYVAVHDAGASLVQVQLGFPASTSREDRAPRMILRAMVDDRVRAVREGLGASYGLDTSYVGGAAGSALVVSGAVDPDRAADAVTQLVTALGDLARGEGLEESFVRARRRALALVLADSCGASDLAGELQALVEAGLPLDGYDALAQQIGATTLSQLRPVLAGDLDPAKLAIVLSGPADVVDAALGAVAGGAEIETLE